MSIHFLQQDGVVRAPGVISEANKNGISIDIKLARTALVRQWGLDANKDENPPFFLTFENSRLSARKIVPGQTA